MNLFRAWLRDDRGMAFAEFALVLPLGVALLLGTADIGYALWLQRKLLSATESVADLLTRENSLTSSKVTEAIRAAQMILDPFPSAGLGYDIVGVEFRTTDGKPIVDWRKTQNMVPDAAFPANAAGLGAKGEGVIGIVMTYTYTPMFFGYVIGPIPMRELSFFRGRKVPLIPYTS